MSDGLLLILVASVVAFPFVAWSIAQRKVDRLNREQAEPGLIHWEVR
jgi:hypothetical protein